MLSVPIVFLTNPTIAELQALEMPVLMDMLAYQTNLHIQLLKEEGLTTTAKTCKACIEDIQAVIELKKSMERNSITTTSRITFTQD